MPMIVVSVLRPTFDGIALVNSGFNLGHILSRKHFRIVKISISHVHLENQKSEQMRQKHSICRTSVW
jgi:hypothetical protein